MRYLEVEFGRKQAVPEGPEDRALLEALIRGALPEAWALEYTWKPEAPREERPSPWQARFCLQGAWDDSGTLGGFLSIEKKKLDLNLLDGETLLADFWAAIGPAEGVEVFWRTSTSRFGEEQSNTFPHTPVLYVPEGYTGR